MYIIPLYNIGSEHQVLPDRHRRRTSSVSSEFSSECSCDQCVVTQHPLPLISIEEASLKGGSNMGAPDMADNQAYSPHHQFGSGRYSTSTMTENDESSPYSTGKGNRLEVEVDMMGGCGDEVTSSMLTQKTPGIAVTPGKLIRKLSSRRRIRKRLVEKDGNLNISYKNVEARGGRYLRDFYTTLVDLRWRWLLIFFSTAFLSSWISFGSLYYLISFLRGDLSNKSSNNIPCVQGLTGFASAFLFSLETQTTIGYGARHINPICPPGIIVVVLQSIYGVIVQCLMVGLVFTKISRPKKRAGTMMFSKYACICKRDEQLCLTFRVGDMRRSLLVEGHVRAILIMKKVTAEGEIIPLHQFDLDLGFDEGADRVFLMWPVILRHVINSKSPFYSYSRDSIIREKFELIVILEGIVESTSMTMQAKSSYLPQEILWGHRFESLVTFQRDDGVYEVDFSRFHNTMAMDTPRCSAQELEEVIEQIREHTDADTMERSDEGHELTDVLGGKPVKRCKKQRPVFSVGDGTEQESRLLSPKYLPSIRQVQNTNNNNNNIVESERCDLLGRRGEYDDVWRL